MAGMSSLLKNALDLNTNLENEIVKLRTVAEEEKKRAGEARFEFVAVTKRCGCIMKRLEDIRKTTIVTEDGLNKVINELEAKDNFKQITS